MNKRKKVVMDLIENLDNQLSLFKLIHKVAEVACIVFLISSLTTIIIGMSLSNSALSSVAFWLLVLLIIFYFVSNVLSKYLPFVDTNKKVLYEYYNEHFNENESKKAKK